VGAVQPPQPGACYENVWHSMADHSTILHDTIRSYLAAGVSPTLLTYSCRTSGLVGARGCQDDDCTEYPIFSATSLMFERVIFIGSRSQQGKGGLQGPVMFQTLVVGVLRRCSPVPEKGLNTTICHTNLGDYRAHLLRALGIPDRVVTNSELACPRLLLLDRRDAKWRRLHNQKDILLKLQQALPQCATVSMSTFSKRVPLYSQIGAVHNSTIVLAGRGAASSLYPFLPRHGGYFSFSSDRWNPFRDLEPKFLVVVHRYVKMTHHDRADMPPHKFAYGYDSNKCGYFETDVEGFVDTVRDLLNKIERRL